MFSIIMESRIRTCVGDIILLSIEVVASCGHGIRLINIVTKERCYCKGVRLLFYSTDPVVTAGVIIVGDTTRSEPFNSTIKRRQSCS